MAIISHITQLLAPIISHHPTSFSVTHMDTNYTNTSPSHRKPHSNNQPNGPIIQIHVRIIRGGDRNFCLGGQVTILIYLSRQPPAYTYTRAFLLYKHTFLFDKLYIYTHPTKKRKKKSLVFSIKLCLMAIFLKIKFIFIVKFLKNFIFDTNYQILY